MFRKKEDMRRQERPNICGGDGVIHANHLFESDESDGHFRLCCTMEIEPGCSIGDHPHGPDGELYYVLEGEFEAVDNGQPVLMKKGDAMFTTGGESHSIRNSSDQIGILLAIVML